MKLVNYISAFCVSLLLLSACDSDLEKVTYNESEAQPARIANIDEAYVLDVQASDQVAIAFAWTKPSINYSGVVTNSLEMDVKGKSFANKVVLASSKTATSYNLLTADLNKAILTFLEKYNMPFGPVDIEFRLVSSISDATSALYSNVVSTKVTPFAGEREYPQVYVVGDYCGWADPNNSFAQCQHLYSEKSNDMYEGWIVFNGKAVNDWKITPKANWDTAWGYDGVFANTLTLATGTDNIKCFNGYSYKFSFNAKTLQLETKVTVQSWGIVGGHNNWGNDTPAVLDTPMTYNTEKDATGKVQHFLTATVEMAAGNTWKIRADNKWDTSIDSNSVDGDFEAADTDANFKVTEAGTYTIKWYFNKVKGRLTVTKK